MQITEAFKGKTLVITGGTGSFGSTVLKHFLTTDIGEIRIFSRDETLSTMNRVLPTCCRKRCQNFFTNLLPVPKDFY